MSAFSGDFLGFQLGEIHSSQLNIVRVSSGDRYSDTLIPEFNNVTEPVPGNDGTYFWDKFYSQKPFTIDFAFDDLRDEDLRKLRQIFGFKGIQPLIFDEFPYKKYMVTCSAPPTLKYIPFGHKEVTVYKGEGTVNLVAYYPYGIGTDEIILRGGETKLQQQLINNGDFETPFKIYFKFNSDTPINKIQIEIGDRILVVENINRQLGDAYLYIDMKTNLIEGADINFNKTGHLYNRFITSGDFFKIPLEKAVLTSNIPFEQIKYNMLYY